MNKELKMAKKEVAKQEVDSFDPLHEVELRAMNSVVTGIKNLVEALEARVKLVGLVYNLKSMEHKMFKEVGSTMKKRLFGGIHALHIDKFNPIHKKLVKAEEVLEDVLKGF